jgi:hypothetical protein
MDTECAVCYSEQATCKLVCKHSFCKSCVKTWYQKSDEPTCPMCRHTLYFKGLHKISEKWEDERNEKLNEEAFNTAFEAIFEEDSDDDNFSSEDDTESDYSESDWETVSDWEREYVIGQEAWNEGGVHLLFNDPETWEADTSEVESSEAESVFGNGDYLIHCIIKLQAAYQKALKIGNIDIPYFLEDDNYLFFDIDDGCTNVVIEHDVFSHEKNLFVSKHAGMIQNRRTGSRVPPKGDSTFTVVFLVEC